MPVKMMDHVVVCLHNKAPLSDLDARRLKERIIESKPHYWEEYEPGIYLAFFLIKRGGRTRSIKLTASARLLKGPGTPLENMGVEKAVGELLTETNWYGKILACPFGDAVNQAIRKSREDAERDFTPREKKIEEEGE